MSVDSIGDDRFRLLTELSPAAIILAGSDGDVQYANAETERMFGYRKEELIGRPIDILVPARLRRMHAVLRRGFLANPSKRPMGVGRELMGACRDGREFPVEIALAPIDTESGLTVVATVLDITERKEVENVLAQNLAELERANERLSQFAYVASLDLLGPLRKIVAFSDVLEKAIASSNQADMVFASKAMRASALGARKLVEDLLIYARTIYGDQQLEVLDLREEVQFTLAALSEALIETNAEINVEIPATAFLADRSQFARLMQNIVSNAIKYRKPGQAPKVDITAVPVGDSTLRLAIVDNGVGFKEEFAQTIFEPFKRLDHKAEYPGTGIELAICKSIADRHGWGISVKSQPGEGATFFFTIPTLFTVPTFEQE